MWFKHRAWIPIAWVLSAVNVAAVWFAAVPGEPAHATVHALLGVLFGLGAQQLRTRRVQLAEPDTSGRFQALEGETDELRQALAEMQERVDFAERVLAQGEGVRRADQER